MKKNSLLLKTICIASAALLCACGSAAGSSDTSAPAAESTQEAAAALSPTEIYEKITSSVELNSPMLVPEEYITNFYDIDPSTLEDYVFSISEVSTSAEMVIILKAKDEASVDDFKNVLNAVMEEKKAEMENYLPDQYDIVNKGTLESKGKYVYLVCSENADSILPIITSNI